MYEFHHDYIKPKFKDFQLCYMDTDSLVYHIKTEDFYADIANDVEERFDTSGYVPNGYYVLALNGRRKGLSVNKPKIKLLTPVSIIILLFYSFFLEI